MTRKATASEHDEQCALFDYARSMKNQDYRYGLLVAFPNQGGSGKSAIIRGRKMVKEGMAKGFPDIGLFYPSGPYNGMFIELKIKGGRLTPEQRWWLNALNEQGYCAVKCEGFEEAKITIDTYFRLGDE